MTFSKRDTDYTVTRRMMRQVAGEVYDARTGGRTSNVSFVSHYSGGGASSGGTGGTGETGGAGALVVKGWRTGEGDTVATEFPISKLIGKGAGGVFLSKAPGAVSEAEVRGNAYGDPMVLASL